MSIAKLVTPLTAAQEIKEQALEKAHELLTKVNAGEVAALVIITVHPDGTWGNAWSGTMEMSAMIGRLEITKLEWIAAYNNEQSSSESA